MKHKSGNPDEYWINSTKLETGSARYALDILTRVIVSISRDCEAREHSIRMILSMCHLLPLQNVYLV